jgi:hypothetical protein
LAEFTSAELYVIYRMLANEHGYKPDVDASRVIIEKFLV